MTDVSEDQASKTTALPAKPGGKDGGTNVEPVTPNDKRGNNVNQTAEPMNINGVEYVPAEMMAEAKRQVDELRIQVEQLVGNLENMVAQRSVAKLREMLAAMAPQAPAPSSKADVQARMVEAARELERQVAAGKREGYTYADVASMAGGSHATAWKALNEAGEVFANLRTKKQKAPADKRARDLAKFKGKPVEAALELERLIAAKGEGSYSFQDVAFVAGVSYITAYKALRKCMENGELFPGLKALKFDRSKKASDIDEKAAVAASLNWQVNTHKRHRIHAACCELEARFNAGQIGMYTLPEVAELAEVTHGGVWNYITMQTARTGNKLHGLRIGPTHGIRGTIQHC